MPAKNLIRIDGENLYFHIFNRGMDKRIIFKDKEDFETFLGFLSDYLSAPKNSQDLKQTFQVKGQTFQGIPHQPKNYFNRIELIAYDLKPDHFHLLLNQLTRGSLKDFLRSLATRYSIYFNKKYHRSGALFAGPYKSIVIKNNPQLLHLTRYFHKNNEGYSSYPEYLGLRKTPWVIPKVVLDFFDKSPISSNYKDFVEKYQLDQSQEELLSSINFESDNNHLEGRDLTSTTSSEKIVEQSYSEEVDQAVHSHSKAPEFLAISLALFVLLLTMGIGNITLATIKSPYALPFPEVLSVDKENKPQETPEPSEPTKVLEEPKVTEETKTVEQAKTILIVKIDDSSSINIREKPSTSSGIISQAHNGDIFESISSNDGWYEIRLDDGLIGFISQNYAQVEEVANNE